MTTVVIRYSYTSNIQGFMPPVAVIPAKAGIQKHATPTSVIHKYTSVYRENRNCDDRPEWNPDATTVVKIVVFFMLVEIVASRLPCPALLSIRLIKMADMISKPVRGGNGKDRAFPGK